MRWKELVSDRLLCKLAGLQQPCEGPLRATRGEGEGEGQEGAAQEGLGCALAGGGVPGQGEGGTPPRRSTPARAGRQEPALVRLAVSLGSDVAGRPRSPEDPSCIPPTMHVPGSHPGIPEWTLVWRQGCCRHAQVQGQGRAHPG